MGHQKDLLSGFSRCFERIFLLLFSFDNPFSHFVGVNGVVGSGGDGLYGRPLSVPVEVGLYGRSLGDCVARSLPLMEVDPSRFSISPSFQRRASTRNIPGNWYVTLHLG